MKHFNALFLATALLFFSCETEKIETQPIDDTTLESINAQISVENFIDEADNVLDNIAIYTSNFGPLRTSSKSDKEDDDDRTFFRNCMDITISRTEMSRTITLTFNGECEDRDGNAITGTIIRTTTFGEGSSENTMTIEDVTINGRTINGTKSHTWIASNENGNPEMNGSVDISVTTEMGTISRMGNRTVEIIEGADTRTYKDDVRSITGSYTYTGLQETFEVNITSALIKPASCRFIVSGNKTYTTSEGTTTLDYGDGTCDEFATATFPDGTESQVTLGTSRNNNEDEDDDNEDTNTKQCTIATNCEEVVIKDTSNISIEVNQVDGVFVIVAKNQDGEVVYEAECEKGANVSVSCSSSNMDDNNDDTEETDEDSTDDDDETADDMATKQCVITTACGEVVIEGTSELKITTTQQGDVFVIVATNLEGEVVYEGECDKGPEVTLECSSETNSDDGEAEEDTMEDDNETEDTSDDNTTEDDTNVKQCVITTECGEIVIEGTSELKITTTQQGDVFVIVATNLEGEVVYEGECDKGPEVTLACSSKD